MAELERSVEKLRPVTPGEYLFHAGNPGDAIYVVSFGSFKSVQLSAEGEEQIVGVYLPGEIMGLDSLARERHAVSNRALERSTVCAIRTTELERVLERLPGLARRIMSMMSTEMLDQQGHHVLLSRKSARERITLFLLRNMERLERRGLDATRFDLSLSRQELGNYLGLQIETVSRTIGKLRDEGLIEVDRRSVVIRRPQRLRNEAGLAPQESACI